ncbi:type III secretion system cytoplasmic ring protein SctQ [Lysobacter sp. H21R4]|uniref:type III secretion system cytoplasmic ring protein SctQ n=1 Tax=Lysobacter sp. H21R4 TaxID=2781021 RepID=UPI00188730E2|nr:type III secretion system cytoplasmic ring protein SctQ [Lysobacter sp. H21R4]QOY63548.1 type III secretion system cytoplasmic ring protein SctQ [Lysobacter sp. H21R4]
MADAGSGTIEANRDGDAAAATKVTSLRGRVPSIAASQLLPLQALFEYPRRWHLADGGRLVFSPGTPDAGAATFAIDADGTGMALRLDEDRSSAERAGLHWSDYEGRSRVLAWSLAQESRLARLSEALGMALVPVLPAADGASTAVPTEADSGDVWLDFVVEEPDIPDEPKPPGLSGLLRLPVDSLAPLLARAGDPYGEDPPVPLGAWPGLPASVAIAFAGPHIPLAEWRTLTPGSVIVAGRLSAPPPVHAFACGRRWPLASDGHGWRVDGPSESLSPPQESSMTSNDEAGAQPEAEAPVGGEGIEQLPVQLRFELGDLELSIAELSALQPGYVFPLASRLEGANVAIRANGRNVGRGEVVAVGDTLGVRLLAWS